MVRMSRQTDRQMSRMDSADSITGGSRAVGEATMRATCWSLTINNPLPKETQVDLPAGWKLEGQFEQGSNGTHHFQGMLQTPQVRFSAVKKVFPRAHIEVARNKKALQQYVSKQETRVAEFTARQSDIPTIFEYQNTVARRWDWSEYDRRYKAAIDRRRPVDCSDIAMEYLDHLVSEDIEKGVRGIEFIAINPMWRSSWKKFYRSIITRYASHQTVSSPEEADASSSPGEEACED